MSDHTVTTGRHRRPTDTDTEAIAHRLDVQAATDLAGELTEVVAQIDTIAAHYADRGQLTHELGPILAELRAHAADAVFRAAGAIRVMAEVDSIIDAMDTGQ